MNKRMLTITEIVEEVGISRSLLYELWKNGDGPRSIHIGRRRLVPVEAAREWLDGLNARAA